MNFTVVFAGISVSFGSLARMPSVTSSVFAPSCLVIGM